MKEKIKKYSNIPDKYKVIDGATLKYIAMFSMLIDHVDKAIFGRILTIKYIGWVNILSNIFEVIGRIAFPIFLFLLVEGYFNTKNKKKYLLWLIIFGLLSEIPYDLCMSGMLFDFSGQNMMFTLALALITIWIIDLIREKNKYWFIFSIIIVLISSYISIQFSFDYHAYGILITYIFYLLKEYRVIASISSWLVILKEIWSITGFTLINFYNGKRGKQNKLFNYLFYPVHLLILGIIEIIFYYHGLNY